MTVTPSSDFCGLHVHSSMSFLDGYATVDDIAEKAQTLGQKAVALTDHQEVGGHIMFDKACRKRDIKPIFGMEGYLVDSYQRVKEEKDQVNSHITLLAKNNVGLKNLWAWSSEAYLDKFYYRALQDWEGAKKWGEGLYASDGCLLAYTARAILEEDESQCLELLSRYLDVFGDNFFMELHTFQFLDEFKGQKFELTDEQKGLSAQMSKVNQGKVSLANQLGIPLVVVNDAHYANEDEWEKHNIVWEMSTGKNKDQTGRGKTAAHMMGDDELVYFMSKHGISEQVTREAIKNTAMIAENCNVTIDPEVRMPRITESDAADVELFIRHVEEGFERKIVGRGLDEDKYWKRTEYETKLIIDKGFAGYFNIVADYAKTARKTMLMGPGRGSASGSLVAYEMDITGLDPLKYELPFERFINPDRTGFPDIDLDFPQSKRPALKQDLADRFGHDKVVTIGTLQTLGPKGMVRDLREQMGVSWTDYGAMSKIFDKAKSNDPEKTSMTWDEIMEQLEEPMREYVTRYPRLFSVLGEMVGMIRGASSHASGILISNEPLMGTLPIRVNRKPSEESGEAAGTPISAFTMKEVEDLGFIKFDVLGIRHLDTIEYCLDLIEKRYGKTIDVNEFGDAEFSDPEIWKPIWAGDTTGIFQLETADMTRVAKRHKPINEVDVADLISVNRPGVIYAGELEPYLLRREGVQAPHFHNPETEKHLIRTYGVLVFQEQIMEIVKDLAGFTPGQADSVRSAVSKKKQAELDLFYEQFISGCLANEKFTSASETGDPRQDAENIWRSIKSSGSYAFSLNHAQAYSIISCWEVWLRHYYYPEFVTALMSTDDKKEKDKPPRTVGYMRHARMRGLNILPPDINESVGKFVNTDEGIRFGFDYVKGISGKTSDGFVPMQPFKDFDDFLERTNVNRGAMFSLIKIGAFDSWASRKEMWDNYVDVIVNGRGSRKKKPKKDREIVMAMPVPNFDDPATIMEIEHDLTSSFVTLDPMGPYVSMIEKSCIPSPDDVEELEVGESCIIGGQITKVKVITIKKEGRNFGKKMCFIGVEWSYNEFDVTLFPEAYERYTWMLKEDECMGKPVALMCIRTARGVHANEIERLDWI